MEKDMLLIKEALSHLLRAQFGDNRETTPMDFSTPNPGMQIQTPGTSLLLSQRDNILPLPTLEVPPRPTDVFQPTPPAETRLESPETRLESPNTYKDLPETETPDQALVLELLCTRLSLFCEGILVKRWFHRARFKTGSKHDHLPQILQRRLWTPSPENRWYNFNLVEKILVEDNPHARAQRSRFKLLQQPRCDYLRMSTGKRSITLDILSSTQNGTNDLFIRCVNDAMSLLGGAGTNGMIV